MRRIVPTDDEDDDTAANDEANHKDQPATVARFIESSLRLEELLLHPNPPFLRPNPGQRRAAPFLDDTDRECTPDPVTCWFPQHVKMPVASPTLSQPHRQPPAQF